MDERLLARLAQPDCYPGHPKSVEIRQTHISVVCLIDDFAYKLKKPVTFSFLDFSTKELRRHWCEEEVRINRRLCPTLYRDVVPLRRTKEGSWSFREGAGEVVDYAVLMDRLPEERLMDRQLTENTVSEEQVRQIARIMATFHQNSEVSPETLEAGSPANQRDAILGNFDLEGAEEVFDPCLFQAVQDRVHAGMDELIGKLEARAEAGFVVDGHGDLHSGNICLTDPPTIFDGIEFRPEFRCGDTAVENAFLVMDLIYRGHPELARVYLETYLAESGDQEQHDLLPMLVSYRALVRAKVDALAALDQGIDTPTREQLRDSARRHLQLAAASLLMNERLVLMTCGLPGTGKTFLGEVLARRSGWAHLASDRIRKELAGVPPNASLPPESYSTEFTQQTYAELERTSLANLEQSPVIADANFRSRQQRVSFASNAQRVLLWVTCDDAVIQERLEQRSQDSTAVSDADFAVYQRLKTEFETPGDDEGFPILSIHGADAPDANLNRILAWLLEVVR